MKDNKTYRILVMEDNEGDYTIVEDFLSEQILLPDIKRAATFSEGSEMIRAAEKPFDVILLDLRLPDKDGQELITEILHVAALSPTIILTGYTDIEFSIRSISQGIYDYLLKDDLTAVSLYKSIIYAIQRKKSISELKASEKRYSDLFYLSPQPMFVFDIETFRFVQVNKAAIGLYGYSEAEFMDMTLMDIKREEDVEEAQAFIKNWGTEEIYKKTRIHSKKSGELMEVEIYSTPIMINDRYHRSVIAIDVTQKNQYEHNITKAIIKTQEDERYEIGGELHDNVCQILATSHLNLGMLKSELSASKMITFDQVNKHIKMAIDEVRNISHRLAPAFFDDTTLEEAFELLIDNFNVAGKYKFLLHFSEAVNTSIIPLDIQRNLYRILQEQLRNILKYSKASAIELDMMIHKNNLKMRIADDGVGFDTSAVKKGIGLSNIKRRAELFYGSAEIISSPGNGCEIFISIPMPEVSN